MSHVDQMCDIAQIPAQQTELRDNDMQTESILTTHHILFDPIIISPDKYFYCY